MNQSLKLSAVNELIIANKSWLKPYPVQKNLITKLGNQAPFILFSGGNRVGKTLMLTVIASCFLTGIYPWWWTGYRFKRPINAVLGVQSHEFVEVLKKKLFLGDGLIPPILNESQVLYANNSSHEFKIKNKYGVSFLKIKTYHQDKLKWASTKLDFIGFDEIPPLKVYNEALLRLTKTDDVQGMLFISATFVDAEPVFWKFAEYTKKIGNSYEKLLATPDDVIDGRTYMFCTWEDVEHLDEETKRLMIANMDPSEIEARTKGIPSIGSGLVYPFDQKQISIDIFHIEKEKYNFVVGMDFGWTNYTALVLLAVCKTTKKIFVIGEYAEKELTPSQHVNNLRSNPIFKNYIDWVSIVHDPSGKAGSITDGKSVASLYSDLGLNMLNANNSVDLGIEKVRACFLNEQLKIYNNCPNIFHEMRLYAYKDSSGKIKKGNDHLLDALRYAVMGLEYARSEKLSKIISFKF